MTNITPLSPLASLTREELDEAILEQSKRIASTLEAIETRRLQNETKFLNDMFKFAMVQLVCFGFAMIVALAAFISKGGI